MVERVPLHLVTIGCCGVLHQIETLNMWIEPDKKKGEDAVGDGDDCGGTEDGENVEYAVRDDGCG